jgi:putative ABC transport system permease protein
MKFEDTVELAVESIRLHRLRTVLTVTGIVVGVVAVLLLTALGEGARRYVVREFSGMGTGLVIILPGKVDTHGSGPVYGGTTRDLTIEDAEAIARRCPSVRLVTPLAVGTSDLDYGGRTRQLMVLGSTVEILAVRNLGVASGRFLTPGDVRRGERVVVIGRTVQREIFRGENPLGKAVRIGDYRMRVIGVLARKGRSLGFDMDDVVIVPVVTAMRMFNQTSLFRVLAQAHSPESVGQVVTQAKSVLMERHDDEEDFTMITQDAMISTFESILTTLTAALAGIAAISLSVAGIGIMNVMLVSVSERKGEVGLLKALGARRRQILTVFLVEAVVLAGVGALAGSGLGVIGIYLIAFIFPEFPVQPSIAWIAVTVFICLAAGTLFGLLPARRASRVDAADALRGWAG